MTWQPIETAPRDGKLIVVYTKGFIDIAFWNGPLGYWETLAFYESKRATHWMPLPEPPPEEEAL